MVCVMNYQEKIWSKYFCIFMALSFSSTLYAQDIPPDVMDGILRGYKDASGASTPGTGWFASIEPVARSLFWKLAAIEFAWSAIVWALQQENMQSFTAVVVKKIMGIGFFYALLFNASTWIPAIINSFIKTGQMASGTGELTPSRVFDRGIDLANAVLSGVSVIGAIKNPLVAIVAGWAAIFIVIAFMIVAAQLLIALIESYIVITAGVLFLGFGGSRWTTDLAQKYISYAVATGVKLFMIYLIIGVALNQSSSWNSLLSTTNFTNILVVLGGSALLAFLAFQIPSMAASMLSGSTSLTAGAAAGTAAAIGAGVATAGGKVISPAMQGAKGGVQAVQAGVAHHRAAGSGMAASAVKGIGTAAKDYAREAGRSAAEALGLASPSSSSSNTIGGRAAESRRGATDAMREQQAASGSSASSQVQPPAQASSTNSSATNTSASNTDAPTGNKTVGDDTADGGTGNNVAAGSNAGATANNATGAAATTREASDKMLDNAPQKMGSATAQTTATNKSSSGSSVSSSNARPTSTDAADATWNSDASEVRAASGATKPPQTQTRQASDTMSDNAPKKMGSAAPQTTAQNTPATSKSDGKNEKPFFEPHQVRPPQIPNDTAPQASVNIRLNHDE